MLGIKLKRVDARRVELWDGAQFAVVFFFGGGGVNSYSVNMQ